MSKPLLLVPLLLPSSYPQGGSLVQSLRAPGWGPRLSERSCRLENVQPFGEPA